MKLRRPEWFWVTIWAQYDGETETYRYRGPVFGFHSASVTVRAGNRMRRRHPGISVIATETLRSGFLPRQRRRSSEVQDTER